MPEALSPEMPGDAATYNLLFVCTGNTCRSPLAQAIARAAVSARGWNHVDVRSAGVSAGEFGSATPQALAVAAQHALDLTDHETTPLTRELIDWADLILVMAPAHLLAVVESGGGGKVALLTDFLEGPRMGEPVDDPFGGTVEDYERAYQQIQEAVAAVLARLEPILAP